MNVTEKSKFILSYFFGWLLIGFFIMFVGVNKIFAATYNTDDFTAQLYDNYGPTLSAVTTDFTNNRYQGYIPSMIANSSGGAWGISSPISLIAGHTYSLTVSIDGTYGGNIVLSTYNRIGVGSILNNAVSSYQQNSNVKEILSKALNDGMTLQFAFTPDVNGSYIVFPFAITSSGGPWTYSISTIIIDDLGKDAVTQDQINTSLNNQTNILNNSINNSTNIITGEIDNLEQSIVDSNKETQDVIKDQFNECRDSYNLLQLQYNSGYTTTVNGVTFIVNDDFSVSVSGSATSNAFLRLQHNIPLTAGTYYFSGGTDGSGTHIQLNTDTSYYANTANGVKTMVFTSSITIVYVEIRIASGWSGEYTFYPMISKKNVSYEPYGKDVCTNRIDETNDKLNDLNSSLNDDDSSGATNDASNFFSSFSTDTFGLTSIVTAPLNLINSITSKTCSELRLPLPYLDNEYLTLPCMNTIYLRYFGSFFEIYQIITFGIVSYWVIVLIFNKVKDFKNPEHDEIEVLDL